MALPEDDRGHDQDRVRRERLEDGRIAIVRIRHRLQRIQDEMDEINRRLRRATNNRKNR